MKPEPFSSPDQLFDHPHLNRSSIVIEAGGYLGDFTQRIREKYGSTVFVFEPCPEFFQKLCERFAGDVGVNLYQIGLGGIGPPTKMKVKGDMTGIAADQGTEFWATVLNPHELARLVDWPAIDLMQINMEGAEFAFLEEAVSAGGFLPKVKTLQVQWHPVVPDAQYRYDCLQSDLSQTHDLAVDGGWVWQIWKLKK